MAEPKTVSDEIDDMLEGLDSKEVEAEAEVVDETVDTEVEVEEEVAESDTIEDEVVEKEEVDDLVEEEEAPDTDVGEGDNEIEEDENEEVSDEVTKLRESFNALAAASLKAGLPLPDDLLGIIDSADDGEAAKDTKVVKDVEEPAAVVVPETQVAATLDDFAILAEGTDFDEFLDSPEAFAKGMREMLGRYQQMLAQRFMQTTPNIVNRQVKQIMTIQKAVDGFYEDNEDLKVVRPTVGAIANQLTEKHPGWTLEEIMDESAKVARTVLRMPSKKVVGKKGKKGKGVRPSFIKSKGRTDRSKSGTKVTIMQKQIDDLID